MTNCELYPFAKHRLTSNAREQRVNIKPVTFHTMEGDKYRKNDSRLVLFEQVYEKVQIYNPKDSVKSEFGENLFSVGNDREYVNNELRKVWLWIPNTITDKIIQKVLPERNILRIFSLTPIVNAKRYTLLYIKDVNKAINFVNQSASFQLYKNSEGLPVSIKNSYKYFFCGNFLMVNSLNDEKGLQYIKQLYRTQLHSTNTDRANAHKISVEDESNTIDLRAVTEYYNLELSNIVDVEYNLEDLAEEIVTI